MLLPTLAPLSRLRSSWASWVALLLPLGFYYYTSAPTIGLGDTALLLEGVQNLKINSHVNNHNITVLLGALLSLLPMANPAVNVTMVSVIVGACTVWVFYKATQQATRNEIVALASSLALMVSHSQWWHSTLPEVYAVNGLFTALTLWLLVSIQQHANNRHLVILYAVAGLSLFNHVSMGVIAVSATVILVMKIAGHLRDGRTPEALKLFGAVTLAFAVGLLPYAATFAHDCYLSGDFGATLNDALFGRFRSIMLTGTVVSAVKDLSYLIWLQFPSFFLLAVCLGAASYRRFWTDRKARLGSVSLPLLNCGFFSFYNTWDKFAFLLPSFLFLAFLGSLGLDRIWGACTKNRYRYALLVALAASIVFPVFLYSQLSAWGRQPGFWHARYNNKHTINTHDVAEYIANPNKRQFYDVETFVNLLWTHLPPNAIFFDDDSRTYYPLRYFQTVLNQRPDVSLMLINSWGFSGWGASAESFGEILSIAHRLETPLFLVTLDWPFSTFLDALEQKYRFSRVELDARRWVYQLHTGEDPAAASLPPKIQRVETGLAFDTDYGAATAAFSPNESIMVRIHFATNTEEFPVSFNWFGPDGKLFHGSEPFVVPVGNTGVWSLLERLPSALGQWHVQAIAGGQPAGEATFTVQDD